MSSVLVNDIHSQLNATQVSRLLEPTGLDALVEIVRNARTAGAELSICGGRHAMGGQQFGSDAWLVDVRRHSAIHSFDSERGLITADAGIQWPELIAGCAARHSPGHLAWGIRQKQTGADRLTLGGSLSANVHGRGLRMPPIIADVEAFTLVDASGEVRRCSRANDAKIFSLAIGGYGLFGIIADVTLRLVPRVKVERRVEVLSLDELLRVPEERDTRDWLFGDFQYAIDEHSPDFLRRGVFSAYHRIEDDRPVPCEQRELRGDDWRRLLHLAHTDRARVFEEYADYYLSTNGQLYWSDTHQLGTYFDGYHADIDRQLAASHSSSEMITEIYVPRSALGVFMSSAAELLRRGSVPVIYGTIRLIERDDESFLAWAREPWACVVFNLCVAHTPIGFIAAQNAFRGLIDLAITHGGSYYLTYHRWATRAQVEACHPRFREFLRLKKAHDPAELFTSDWHRHYRALFAA
jgi:FAD/FMN-containing dehydrogenase